MKKLILFLVIGLFGISTGYSQSLVIKDKSGNEKTGQTIDFLCTPSIGYGSIELDVFNVSGSRKSVKVRRYDIALGDSAEITMCWLSCYPAFVTESPDAILIEPGAFSPNFTGDIAYHSPLGTSTSKFVFFDVDNPVDSSFITVNFVIGYLGVNNNHLLLSEISNAYPNPASGNVNFDYKLPAYTNNARIRVINLLGTVIDELTLEKTEGKASLNVSNLKNGIYFYSLMINNSATITRKFVVKR